MGIPPLKWFCHVTTPITTFHLSMGISSLAFILSFKGSIDPIQYPVPTHGYTTPHDHFVDVPSGMTQSNPQFQYMGIPPPMIILSMYRQV